MGEVHEASGNCVWCPRRRHGDRDGAALSVAANHHHRAISSRWTDRHARILADHMSTSLAQSVIIENVSGATGSIGVGRVARAAADGYTLSIGHWSTHVVNGATMSLAYDVLHDFAPVSLLADTPIWMVARKTLPPKNLAELIAWLKQNPSKATAGTVGVGGQIKAYAMMTKSRGGPRPIFQRWKRPECEASMLRSGTGCGPPKGTPTDIISKLNAAVRSALADPSVRQRFANQGQEIPPRERQTLEGLGAQQQAEIEKWWPIIKAAGIKAM